MHVWLLLANMAHMDLFANRIIDKLGGTYAVARICDIKPPSVCKWRHKGISRGHLKYLRLRFPVEFAEVERDMVNEGTLKAASGA